MARTPSPQQREVYRWVRTGTGNLLLVAVAGSGKTTTILNASTMMGGDVVIVAYNTKISDEIKGKLERANIGKNVRAGTFHSFGMRSWGNHIGRNTKLTVDKNKTSTIMEHLKVPQHLEEFVAKIVSMGKNRAFGIATPIEDEAAWIKMIEHYDLDSALPEDGFESIREEGIHRAMQVLKHSAEIQDHIDYDDMLWLPLYFNVRMWQNHWICVDEAQDTNPARRLLAHKMLIPGSGRAIFVGDPAQAIYGFTGADNDSLDIIRDEFKCKDLPLTVTYRCPKLVVDVARQYVSHITAADSAPMGVVASITAPQFAAQPAAMFTSQAAMLCRMTAPLVAQAFALIRRNIPCHVEGKEIGKGLLNLTRKWQTNSLTVFIDKLADYRAREVEKLLEAKKEQKAEALSDRVDTLFVIAENLPDDATLNDLRRKITDLFGDTPDGVPPKHFTLSTVHKSKGREWDTVYILDRAKLMPSPYARQDWQKEQEKNLIYVAVTRSQGTLVDVVS